MPSRRAGVSRDCATIWSSHCGRWPCCWRGIGAVTSAAQPGSSNMATSSKVVLPLPPTSGRWPKSQRQATCGKGMTDVKPMSPSLRRLVEEDAVGQLVRGDRRMAQLGREDGVLKLDWVEGVGRLLANDSWLEEVESEAGAICRRGIRHIIWSGMGGSVMTVRVLTELGFCTDSHQFVAIYPLDSTDPAALKAIVRRIAEAKDISLPAGSAEVDADVLITLLQDVMMIGVSMGM